MTKKISQKLFQNLYDNKTILLPKMGPFCFCEFLKSDFKDNKLIIYLKVLEPVFRLKPRYITWFEKPMSESSIEIQYNFLYENIISLKIEQQYITSVYGSSIWANHGIVKKVYELKAQGLDEEIYEILS
ncbi:hypothetical protein FO597_07150 [Riemerella anatipestifer]|uniref:hypothetical protein n=1 Tax=Riemerella anatipestifer TaxID=34085 RepID=UPI0007EDC195|nr:hypothetical protein [Riemerella anatipestifer]MCE4248523.1 hypothetical protein [Riemerella anatipestifer]MCU7580966.1 hypothetical protein [Riemerella anatipestifer]MDR7834058.1 hypothetical protein [Riemerella anatipestifer]MWV19903.1 hypothetical protein [Riemerella anatipestifer]OBP52764.1 hypothetical protein AWM66_07000 [Riemerella anatipestifer]